MALTKHEKLTELLAEEFLGGGWEGDLSQTEVASRRMTLDRIADRITNLVAEPKSTVHETQAARVVMHREEQAEFSIAFPMALALHMKQEVIDVVDRHYDCAIPNRHYTAEPGDAILLIRRASYSTPPVPAEAANVAS